jgi:hypothetical protein
VTLVWVALVVALTTIAGSIALVVVRALELWRSARGFFSVFGSGLDEFARRMDALASREPAELQRLEPSLERLRRSSAQLAVLRNAVKRVQEQASGVLALYPRK